MSGRSHLPLILLLLILTFATLSATQTCAQSEFDPLAFKPLFNDKNLDGWINVNTAEDTWRVKKGGTHQYRKADRCDAH